MSSFPQFLRSSKGILLVGILIAWLCIYLAFSSGDREGEPGEGAQPGIVMEELGDTTADADSEAVAMGAGMDTIERRNDVLEQKCDTFNFEEFTVENLRATLQQYFGLRVEYPAIARSLKLEALERGGNPLGEILANMLAPHGYAFFRQGDLVQIVAAEYGGGEAAADSAPSRTMGATIVARLDSPFDLWIDTYPPIALRVVTQPLSGESSRKTVGFTLEARRGGRVWFRHALDAPLGETAMIESRGSERMRLFVKPTGCDDAKITIEIRLEHEVSLQAD